MRYDHELLVNRANPKKKGQKKWGLEEWKQPEKYELAVASHVFWPCLTV